MRALLGRSETHSRVTWLGIRVKVGTVVVLDVCTDLFWKNAVAHRLLGENFGFS
jgi:hypothetical protein